MSLIVRNCRRLLQSSSAALFRRYTTTAPELPVLTLFTIEDCSLCDVAIEDLEPYLHLVTLEKVDISLPENKEWHKKYQFDIPVFHLNGQFLMQHKADIEKLLGALEKPQ